MEFIAIIGCLVGVLVSAVDGGAVQCVIDNRPGLRSAVSDLDKLEKPDICRTGLTHLQDVKDNLVACPDLQEDNELNRVLGQQIIGDLMTSTSAESYCTCSPVVETASKLNFESTSVTDPEHGIGPLPNFEYICGTAHMAVLGLSQAMGACKDLMLTRSPNLSENDTLTYKNLGLFAQKHCYMVNEDGFKKNSACVLERARQYGYRVCLKMAKNYKDEEDITCGERFCVHKSMETCPDDWQKFYIDAVNVYSRRPLPEDRCPDSAASLVVSIVLNVVAIVTVFLVV